MDFKEEEPEKQGYTLGVIAPAQHEGQESESEQCQGKKGKVGKHRKSKDRGDKLVNKYLDKVSEGNKDSNDDSEDLGNGDGEGNDADRNRRVGKRLLVGVEKPLPSSSVNCVIS